MIDQLLIQNDFVGIITDLQENPAHNESFWLRLNGSAYHIECSKKSTSLFKCLDGDLNFAQLSATKFQVTTENRKINFRMPLRYFTSVSTADLVAFDLAPDGHSVVAGDSTGSLRFGQLNDMVIYETTHCEQDAHFSDVTKIKFFPSSKVFLSVGLDLSIKIWSFADGSNPRTLRKQKKRITDVVLVGRGRNVLSASLDGSIIVYECGSGEPLHQFRRVKDLSDGVQAIAIGDWSGKTESPAPVSQEGFFEMAGKVCFAGHESGFVSVWDLGTRTSLGEFEGCAGGVSAMVVHGECLVVGGADGSVRCFDRAYKLLWEAKLSNEDEAIKIESFGECLYCLTAYSLVSLDATTGEVVEHFLGHDSRLNDVKVSAEGVFVVGKNHLAVRY